MFRTQTQALYNYRICMIKNKVKQKFRALKHFETSHMQNNQDLILNTIFFINTKNNANKANHWIHK